MKVGDYAFVPNTSGEYNRDIHVLAEVIKMNPEDGIYVIRHINGATDIVSTDEITDVNEWPDDINRMFSEVADNQSKYYELLDIVRAALKSLEPWYKEGSVVDPMAAVEALITIDKAVNSQ